MPFERIHHAAVTGDEAEVVRLVQEDARRLNEQTEAGWSPLMYAVYRGQEAVVTRLLALGANATLQNAQSRTATHEACWHKHDTVLALLVDAGAPLNARDHYCTTPLMLAAYRGAVECVVVLLSRGWASLELDAANDLIGWTAVHYAASEQRPQILRLLLDAGAHPAIPDCDGRTPLDLARRKPNNPCTPLLQAALAEPQRPRLLLKARALADAASDVRIAQDNSQSRGPAAQRQAAVAAAPAYLKPRVQTGQRRMPRVAVNNEQQDNEEELGACVRFVLGLQGHGGWAGAEDERATMREQGLFRGVFVELAELLVPAWDRADV